MKTISFSNDVLPLKNELYRLALRITLHREEAEDVVQETLIKVWNRRESWQNIESIEAYALTVCRNMAIDRLRKKDNQHDTLDENIAQSHTDNALSPYEKMQQRDRIRIVRDIIDALPEKQKSCMQLRDIEGKSYKEIAQTLGISEEQVKINIYRARQTVKSKIQTLDKYGL